ncbi:hypothetical protein [Corynebacterium hindlerae]|uniref:hypothetical protein n=1 Tax=Corynebacterium hindlerae TaxID=699041 RepID=UPI0031B70416
MFYTESHYRLRRDPQMRKLMLLAFSVALVAGSIPAVSGAEKESAQQVQRSQFSDDELVMGILFGEGEVGQRLTSKIDMPERSPNQQALAQEAMDDLVTDMKMQNPQRYHNSIEKIRTGDPYEAEDGVVDLHNQLKEASEKRFDSGDAVVQPMCGAMAVCVAGMYVAIVGAFAVVYVAAIEVGAHTALWVKTGVQFEYHNQSAKGDLEFKNKIAKVASLAKS